MTKTNTKKTSAKPAQTTHTKEYLWLIALPFILMAATLSIQLFDRYVLKVSGQESVIVTVINVLSILIGIASTGLFILIPVWIILLIRELRTK